MPMKTLQNDPTDPLPTRVQVSLWNVRALVEQLQNDEKLRGKWIRFGLLGFLPLAVLLGIQMMRSAEDPVLLAKDRTRPCELAIWAAKSGELERSLRESGMPNTQIQKKIEQERPFIMANAKIECNSTAGK